MCHLSPTVHLAWAILSCGLQIFLIQHLWRYDRFKCLAWSSGRQPGTFKRVMTYSYCGCVPTLLVYSVSMAVLKYRNGYSLVPGLGIVPTPFQLWPANDRSWLTPLYIVFGVAWGLELVTHLEELMFWLFLLHQGPTRREWFRSIEFKVWALTSSIAMAGMPLTAIMTRSDPLRSEAFIFLVGGAASTSVTAVFFIVLAKFPGFLRRVKREGAAGPVVLRLVKFHELNILRVIFRLLMTVPLLILGVDGVRNHHHINDNPLWTDLLAFFAAVGTIVSSTLTLLIFFPRSLAEDSNWRPRSTENHSQGSCVSDTSPGGQIRPVMGAKPSYNSDYDHEAAENPFSHPHDAVSPMSPESSKTFLSKTKTKYFSGHFTSPSALTTAYYPPTLDSSGRWNNDYELREMEEGEMEGDQSQPWRVSDSETVLASEGQGAEKREQARFEEQGSYSAKRATKDPSSLTARMVELGEAIDAGLKKPQRPPRLHPYITSFTSPIDLMHPDDEAVPRAI